MRKRIFFNSEKGKMRSFYIKDNVCTPYKLILNRINNYLMANDMVPTTNQSEADVVIIGTCGAFKSLEDEAVGFIEAARTGMKSGAELVVFGCLPGINMKRIRPFSPNRVIPSFNWTDVKALIEDPAVPLKDIPEATGFRGKEDHRLYDPGKQFILLQTGCSSDCPFCPHKLGIGNLKSVPPESIFYQIRNLEKKVHTICLAGNDTGSYGTDIGTTYPELLKKIIGEFDFQIHLSQINADWVHVYRDELWPLLMDKKVREFQVLIQSTSNRVLALMDRKPVVTGLKPYFKKLRVSRRDLILRTDLIIGYPTATEQEDLSSVEFVAEIFDEVAVHGFERVKHARIEKMGLPFYSAAQIDERVEKVMGYLRRFPHILAHRGGQVIRTLEAIEKPKNELRKRLNAGFTCKDRGQDAE
ncbi:MAG: radical SAM protein [Candidatus Omnitrophica bacterium]|nr:radical SAM protein [Candidatus Omnitrophota bacterium]